MSIRVGTLAKRYKESVGHQVCYLHTIESEFDNSDNQVDLGVCLAIVVDTWNSVLPGSLSVTVNWLQVCKYHQKMDIAGQEVVSVDNLWEVGQLL